MALGLPAARHEAGPAEHAKVLRDRGLGNAEVAGELPDGVGPAAQPVDEAAARRIGEGLDSLCISHSLYKYILIH